MQTSQNVYDKKWRKSKENVTIKKNEIFIEEKLHLKEIKERFSSTENELKKLQSKAIRIILKVDRYTPIKICLKYFNGNQ